MKPGIYPNMTRKEYDAIGAINISTLKKAKRGNSPRSVSMAHLKHAIDYPPEKTDALRVGIAAHLGIYESERFHAECVIAPEVNKRTKAGKAELAEFEAVNSDKLILSRAEYEQCREIYAAVHRHETARALLDGTQYKELAIVWVDPTTGLLCKGMLDGFGYHDRVGVISDAKTCQDASDSGFSKAIANFDYHVAAAWYLDGLNTIAPAQRRFAWIAAEKSAPYGVATYWLDEEAYHTGRWWWMELIQRYAKCLETGIWPGYDSGISDIYLPGWCFTTGNAA